MGTPLASATPSHHNLLAPSATALSDLKTMCRAPPKKQAPLPRRPLLESPGRRHRSPGPVNLSPRSFSSDTSRSSRSRRRRSSIRGTSSSSSSSRSDTESSSSPSRASSSVDHRRRPQPPRRPQRSPRGHRRQSSPPKRATDRKNAGAIDTRPRSTSSHRRYAEEERFQRSMHQDDDISIHKRGALQHGRDNSYERHRERLGGKSGIGNDIREAQHGHAAAEARTSGRAEQADVGPQQPQRRRGVPRDRLDDEESSHRRRVGRQVERTGRRSSLVHGEGGDRDVIAHGREWEGGRATSGRLRSAADERPRGAVDRGGAAPLPSVRSRRQVDAGGSVRGKGSLKTLQQESSGGLGIEGDIPGRLQHHDPTYDMAIGNEHQPAVRRDDCIPNSRHRSDGVADKRPPRHSPDTHVSGTLQRHGSSRSRQLSGNLDDFERTGGSVLDRVSHVPGSRNPAPPSKRLRGHSPIYREGPTRQRAPSSPPPSRGVTARSPPQPPLLNNSSRSSRWAPGAEAAMPQPPPPPPPPPPPHPAEALRANGAASGKPAPSGHPEFGLSGVLAADSKRNAHGKVVKYSEPVDKAVPLDQWRIYTFKDGVSP